MERPQGLAATILCIVLICSVVLAATGPVTADEEYEITVSGSVDTPTREVEKLGETYEISSIAKTEINSSIDIDVTAPDSDSEYKIYLYNSENQVATGPEGDASRTGDTTATFDLTNLDAGTYAFGAVDGPGAPDAVHPLVIEAFDTSINSAPSSATVGEKITVNVDVDRDSEADDDVTKDRVEVVVANESTNITETATDDSGDYTATVDTRTLGAGSYNLYATVRGTEEVLERDEILGISEDQSLTVESADDSESTDTSEPDGTGGGGGGAAPAPAPGTATATPGATTTPSQTTATPRNSTDPGADGVTGTQIVSQTRTNITVNPESGAATATFDDTTSVERIDFQSGSVSDSTSTTGSVQVTEVSAPPAETGVPPGSSTTVTDIQVPTNVQNQSATVRFRISMEQIETIGATPEALRVYRYTSGEWQQLDARIANETATNVTVAADTPGFSFFSASAVGTPTATMTISSTTTTELTLNASESTDRYGTVVRYEWTIAGQTLTGETATVTIEESGEYTAELTVTNDAGETDTVTETVRIAQNSAATAQSPAERGEDQPTTASSIISPATDEPEESSRSVGLPIYTLVISVLLGMGYVAFRYRG
jgi:PGF-pre-PGF domain-containing protein